MLKKGGSSIGDFSRSQRFLKDQTSDTENSSAKTSVSRAVILLKSAISDTQLSGLESGKTLIINCIHAFYYCCCYALLIYAYSCY